MKKKILAVIPARGGSKGVPRKNIRELAGKPLIGHIAQTALKSTLLDKVILSTDDEVIAGVGRDFGLAVPFLRPNELATDGASSISVIKHALKFFDGQGERFDAVISLQATNPLTSLATVDQAVELWLKTGCDSVVTLALMANGHPFTAKRIKDNSVVENFVVVPPGIKVDRRQDREPAYYLTGALYLRSRSLIEDENIVAHHLGQDCRAVVTNDVESLDINSEFDFNLISMVIDKKWH